MDMIKMMKQVAGMKKIQKQLSKKQIEFSSAGGLVRVRMSGDMQPQSVTIDPDLIQSGHVKKIEAAVLDAFKGALHRAQEEAAQEMKTLTAGLGLPF